MTEQGKKTVVIVLYSLKGGTGKSSSTILLANCLASAGKKVLVMDVDLNNSTSFCYLESDKDKETKNMARALQMPQGGSLLEYTLPANIKGVDIIQSSLYLVDLRALPEKRLKSLLPTLNGEYDFVIIDCPPAYDNIVLNTLYAADYILTPIQLSQFDFNTAIFLRGKMLGEIEKMDSWYLFFNGYEKQYERFENSAQSDYVRLFENEFDNFLPVQIPKTSLIRQYTDRREKITASAAKEKLYTAVTSLCSIIAQEEIVPIKGAF